LSTEPALPRSVRRGPRITLSCHCGRTNYLQYGERWTCEECGRTWDTQRIPLEEYRELRRTQLRYRRVPIAMSAVALACIVIFLALGKGLAGLIVVAFVAAAYSMFARPLHRRRYREALARIPSWDIDPE
jgi:hypothetical protein